MVLVYVYRYLLTAGGSRMAPISRAWTSGYDLTTENDGGGDGDSQKYDTGRVGCKIDPVETDLHVQQGWMCSLLGD